MRRVYMANGEIMELTEELSDHRDLCVVLQLQGWCRLMGQWRYAGCQIYKLGNDAAF